MCPSQLLPSNTADSICKAAQQRALVISLATDLPVYTVHTPTILCTQSRRGNTHATKPPLHSYPSVYSCYSLQQLCKIPSTPYTTLRSCSLCASMHFARLIYSSGASKSPLPGKAHGENRNGCRVEHNLEEYGTNKMSGGLRRKLSLIFVCLFVCTQPHLHL